MTIASSVLSERPESHSPSLPELHFQQPTADILCVGLDGSWTIQSELPPLAEVQRQFDTQPSVQRLTFETQGLTGVVNLFALLQYQGEREAVSPLISQAAKAGIVISCQL
jgi:hypothetical protein